MRTTNEDLNKAAKVVDHRDNKVKTDNLTGYINLPAGKYLLIANGDLENVDTRPTSGLIYGTVTHRSNGGSQYELLANNENRLYQNNGQYQRESEQRARVQGRAAYRMIPVNKDAFEQYQNYLKTGENGNLRIAEAIMGR